MQTKRKPNIKTQTLIEKIIDNVLPGHRHREVCSGNV